MYRLSQLWIAPALWLAGECLGLAVLVCCLPTPARAQADGGEVSPEVQALYAQAKAAQAHGDTSTAVARYRSILKLAPRLAPAYNNLGLLYYSERDYPHAAEVLEQGLRIDPNMPSASALLGSALFAMGQDAKARGPLEAAVRGNPADGQAEMTLARVLIRENDNTGAAAHLRHIVQQDSRNQEAWYLLGKTYMKLSEEALGQVSRIDPESPLAHEISGELMESMQNMDGAIVEYKKAADLAPHRADALAHLANGYWMLGKWDSARAEFEKELAIDPNDCVAQWKLGNTMLEEGDAAAEALPALSASIQRCPSLAQARVDHARALIKLGRQSEALPDLLSALKTNPDEPSIHFLLASVYRAQGNTAQAQAEMQTYGRLQRAASAAVAQRASESLSIKQDAH
jgi:tetratricopeptide (TPR) repeat protein